jgi:hypothetical protein
MPIQIFFLVVSLVLFALGAWPRWGGAPGPGPWPWYPPVISAGLFFYVLAQLWPMISK